MQTQIKNNMKVVIVNEKGAYKEINGLTFELNCSVFPDKNGEGIRIPELNTTFAAVNIEGTTVDTPLANIVIVDYEIELKNIETLLSRPNNTPVLISKIFEFTKALEKWYKIQQK